MFKLIDLPYKSLAPVISDETLSFHHGIPFKATLRCDEIVTKAPPGRNWRP
ncbi:MAG: hypothetical protein IJU74_00700 [Bacteroidales bacterium]|nr:hypothetical protein [Bacteroidales bacterium]